MVRSCVPAYIEATPLSGYSGIIITDVADHFGTFYVHFGKQSTNNSTLKNTRTYSQANMTKFKDEIDNTNFSTVIEEECLNIAYNEFIRIFMIAFDKSFPLKITKSRSRFVKREPWYSTELLECSQTRMKLLKKKLTKPTEANINAFKAYNNMYNKQKRTLKINYFKRHLKKINSTPKMLVITQKSNWEIQRQICIPSNF